MTVEDAVAIDEALGIAIEPLVDRIIALEKALKRLEGSAGEAIGEKANGCQLAKDLEPRVAALEAAQKAAGPGLEYHGVWSPATRYPKNAVVSWDGSMWVARSEGIGQKPGDGPSHWQLAVQRGKPGKDAR